MLPILGIGRCCGGTLGHLGTYCRQLLLRLQWSNDLVGHRDSMNRQKPEMTEEHIFGIWLVKCFFVVGVVLDPNPWILNVINVIWNEGVCLVATFDSSPTFC